MAPLSADDKRRRIQDIIRTIDQKHLQISHEIKLLKGLAVPKGESETMEVADVDCPRYGASEGKYLYIHNELSYLY